MSWGRRPQHGPHTPAQAGAPGLPRARPAPVPTCSCSSGFTHCGGAGRTAPASVLPLKSKTHFHTNPRPRIRTDQATLESQTHSDNDRSSALYVLWVKRLKCPVQDPG